MCEVLLLTKTGHMEQAMGFMDDGEGSGLGEGLGEGLTIDKELYQKLRFTPVRHFQFSSVRKSQKFDILICEADGGACDGGAAYEVSFFNEKEVGKSQLTLTCQLPALLVRFSAGLFIPLKLTDFEVQRQKRRRGLPSEQGSGIEALMQKRYNESETLQHQQQRLHASECEGLTCLTSQDALSFRNAHDGDSFYRQNDVVASPRCGFEPSERELSDELQSNVPSEHDEDESNIVDDELQSSLPQDHYEEDEDEDASSEHDYDFAGDDTSVDDLSDYSDFSGDGDVVFDED